MRKILLLFLFLPFCASAQVFDDFSDGDFTVNPSWIGTDTSFTVNKNSQLQLAASSVGEAWLATAIEGRNEEWRFWIRETFSPSTKNYAEVWLCADTSALPLATRGYFLRFGSVGSQDAIELYRKDSTGEQLICKGADAAIASSFMVEVKVLRNEEGHWTLATDYENAGNYTVEAEGVDDTYPPEGYFGFYLKFTVSNARKFYFDDIYLGPEIVDAEPPELLDLEVVDAQRLLLSFSEPLSESALAPQHYLVEDEPDSVFFEGNSSKVKLCFSKPLPENTNLLLKVVGISDPSGNIMPPTERPFSIYHAAENDIVINEIFADPTPVVGLPEWEYVELFNTSSFTIDLKDWIFCIGNTNKTFPAIQMEPQGYLILCHSDAERDFEDYGPTCGFPSFTIANAGATLRLFSSDETLMSEVSFNDNWYHDAEKKNGGWSLEQIDPFNPCAGTVNWSASTDVSGGTPGRLNSINAPNATVPRVDRVNMLGDHMLLLWFDQQMDRASLEDPLNFFVEELILYPEEVVLNPVESSSLELVFGYSFEKGKVYTLTLSGMKSCSGQEVAPDTKVQFGIPNDIHPGEILINEILFNPISPGVDYVELYNYSEKTFDLSELKLGVIKERFPNPTDTVLKEITPDSRLFLPHTYVLLSTDGYTVSNQYECGMEVFFDMESFPSYANSGGIALLMNREGVTVDQMSFSEEMHYPLLKETQGVSLERVSWEVSSDQTDNWHSAAEAVHFGTPGYANSMMRFDQGEAESFDGISAEPKVFSPDGDGFDDCCRVAYRLEQAGMTMNVFVYSADGRQVRHLVKGELVSQEGSFVWNGLDNRGCRVPIGIYIVAVQVFNVEGGTWEYKTAVAVASR